MIECKNIHKFYASNKAKSHILKGINLTVNQGEFLAIMGSSGSGKSTLLNILGILDYADEGEYCLNQELIHKLSENQAAEYRNKFIGFVFQSFSLIGYKNVKENVELPLYYQGVASKERTERTEEILEKVGLLDKLFAMPNELSGGQQQRVAIARALVTKPKVILADEPTGALDSKSSHDFLDLLHTINEEKNTIIMVTHDREMANRAKKIIEIKDGLIVG
jgi:putative ABC transport system ATP-binding protein